MTISDNTQINKHDSTNKKYIEQRKELKENEKWVAECVVSYDKYYKDHKLMVETFGIFPENINNFSTSKQIQIAERAYEVYTQQFRGKFCKVFFGEDLVFLGPLI